MLFDADEDACNMMVCRAGRECRIDGNGEATCACIESCPDNFVPVCGSNGKSYDNYCLMHRDACLTGTHISLRHKGYCTKSKKSKKAKDSTVFEPVVCFQWERDALRRQMLSYFRQHTIDQSWYRPGLRYSEKVWARFYVCDTSKDNFLDANELLACLKDVPFSLRTTATNNDLVKALCVDAMVDSADSSSDWRLDFEEFKKLADSDFQPKEKMCSLENKKYEDGSQTKVDCNDCVCACGSWVCTSKACDQLSEIEEIDEDEVMEEDGDDILNDTDNDIAQDVDDQKLATKILEIEEDDTNVDPDEDDIVDENVDDAADDDDDADDYDDDFEEEKKVKKSKKKKKNAVLYFDDE